MWNQNRHQQVTSNYLGTANVVSVAVEDSTNPAQHLHNDGAN